MGIWQSILDVFHRSLVFLHDGLDGFFGEAAWGWAIISLTVVVRVLLLPLAIKQTRSMRAMQALQPKIKKLQAKYKVDKDLMRKDPETYRARKSKLNEEMMALYREEGVNPVSGCLPLLLQAPIFFALFRVLNDQEFSALQNADFYFFTRYVSGDVTGLGGAVSAAGWPGWLLILLMAGTMFWSQRQMMARNSPEGAQAQQQKIMMYAMPVFLGFVSLNFPMGVLLYWVTTNLWQMGQQAVILREVQHEAEVAEAGGTGKGQPQNPKKGRSGPTGGRGKSGPDKGGRDDSGPKKKDPKNRDPKKKDPKNRDPKKSGGSKQDDEDPKNGPKGGGGKRGRGRPGHLPGRDGEDS